MLVYYDLKTYFVKSNLDTIKANPIRFTSAIEIIIGLGKDEQELIIIISSALALAKIGFHVSTTLSRIGFLMVEHFP